MGEDAVDDLVVLVRRHLGVGADTVGVEQVEPLVLHGADVAGQRDDVVHVQVVLAARISPPPIAQRPLQRPHGEVAFVDALVIGIDIEIHPCDRWRRCKLVLTGARKSPATMAKM